MLSFSNGPDIFGYGNVYLGQHNRGYVAVLFLILNEFIHLSHFTFKGENFIKNMPVFQIKSFITQSKSDLNFLM